MKLIETFKAVKLASRSLTMMDETSINNILNTVADSALASVDTILEANRMDLSLMDESNPKYDRLKLTPQRIADIAKDIRNVASLPSPLGIEIEKRILPNGLRLKKVSVPFGVIGVIYEARPNVSFDVFSLCLKSGSACILKGGSDAYNSNKVIVELIHSVLDRFGVSEDIVRLLPPDRDAATELLHANDYVDVLIPRGSSNLINYVRAEATVPVIETGAGICHTYFDLYGDINIGAAIVNNAKTRRVSVCNALDCLIVHKYRLKDLSKLCSKLADSKVIIYADDSAYDALNGNYPSELLQHATEDSFGTEFLDYKMAIKTVSSPEEAISHIYKYSSKHSECVVTQDDSTARYFEKAVDAACVYVNAPTSFTDGAQFGLGAEIGISTQKLHARGPMGLREITTYKWLIEGEGQVRP